MTVRTLQVLINGALVGTLRDADNIWAFQYASTWLESPSAFSLAPSIPLVSEWQVDGASVRPVQWFFDNLLPEELMRQVLAKEVEVESTDAFGMLERMGMESAGALVLQAEGAAQAEKGTLPLSWNDLSQRIRNLPRASLNKDAPKRMSLAGAQHKMVVLFDPERKELSEPLKGTPSTHILKPNSTAEGYPNSVINETFTMLLAARLGLNVPEVWNLYLPEAAFIITRFDREPGPTEPIRLHALDGIQVLNEPAHNKYTSATLPKLKVLIGQCRNKALARMEVYRWIVFNTMVGNSDAHLKNISFLVDHDGKRVAPFYDLLCTAVYHTRVYSDDAVVWPNEKLASPIAGANFFSDVTYEKLIDTGMELGLPKSTAAREVGKIVGKLQDAADEIAAKLEGIMRDPGAPQGAPTRETMGAETHLLRSICKIVIADMLARVRLPTHP
ncbi:HipA N-terminal domain-containing protein [Acidovorax sp. NO-1]|uniref:HipA domain-containing protein n=1 Tax=Acidovorax sp. NO-1 TaxID=512030 RepID=UPI00023FCD6F|nr:HipA domain-containing protein [Acidovorax sp. NO-1]EHL24811.1 HipA N-terminal domain-containing protein [Acidovorax sp. NO-1]